MQALNFMTGAKYMELSYDHWHDGLVKRRNDLRTGCNKNTRTTTLRAPWYGQRIVVEHGSGRLVMST
jgi:hypothetical protein